MVQSAVWCTVLQEFFGVTNYRLFDDCLVREMERCLRFLHLPLSLSLVRSLSLAVPLSLLFPPPFTHSIRFPHTHSLCERMRQKEDKHDKEQHQHH